MKAVYRLGQLGYLDTLRGKHGGIRLAKDPSDIGIGDLIRQTEEDMALVECFQAPGGGRCCIVGSCILRVALAAALEDFLRALDRYTLADLLGPRDRLAALLSVDRQVPSPKSPSPN